MHESRVAVAGLVCLDLIPRFEGTGDCAIAGLLAALQTGESPERAITLAAAAGAASAQQADAVSGIPPWRELCERVQSRAARKEISFRLEAGWTFDETDHVWKGPRDRQG